MARSSQQNVYGSPFIGPCILKEYATPFKFKTYVPFERKPDDPMKEHIKRLMDKLIPWHNTFSEQDAFASGDYGAAHHG